MPRKGSPTALLRKSKRQRQRAGRAKQSRFDRAKAQRSNS